MTPLLVVAALLVAFAVALGLVFVAAVAVAFLTDAVGGTLKRIERWRGRCFLDIHEVRGQWREVRKTADGGLVDRTWGKCTRCGTLQIRWDMSTPPRNLAPGVIWMADETPLDTQPGMALD